VTPRARRVPPFAGQVVSQAILDETGKAETATRRQLLHFNENVFTDVDRGPHSTIMSHRYVRARSDRFGRDRTVNRRDANTGKVSGGPIISRGRTGNGQRPKCAPSSPGRSAVASTRDVIHMYYMPLHSVRFDDEAEAALVLVCDATHSSPSEVLQRGVFALAKGLGRKPPPKPFEIYRKLDLGPGGYARAPARQAKSALAALIRRKHLR
jgi:hypothetical protein